MGIISGALDLFGGVNAIYWFCAIAGSLLLVLQFVLMCFGVGVHDTPLDGDGTSGFGEHADTGFADFRFFSIRSVISFIAFFGWGGVLWGHHGWIGFVGAFASGFFMMFVTALLVAMLLSLQQNGTVEDADIVGCKGSVYFNIPAGRTESGKVTVTVKHGCTREIQAVADESLPTGTAVVVEAQIDGKRFLVKKV